VTYELAPGLKVFGGDCVLMDLRDDEVLEGGWPVTQPEVDAIGVELRKCEDVATDVLLGAVAAFGCPRPVCVHGGLAQFLEGGVGAGVDPVG